MARLQVHIIDTTKPSGKVLNAEAYSADSITVTPWRRKFLWTPITYNTQYVWLRSIYMRTIILTFDHVFTDNWRIVCEEYALTEFDIIRKGDTFGEVWRK